MVWEASGLSTQFALPGKHSGAVARACRRHFRRATAMGLPYQSEATQLLKRFEEAKKLIQDLGDWDTAETSDLQLLKSFDCGGHQQVQRGDLLLAHPMSCIRDPNFDQATVLISDVGEDYVSGFVVNKPLRNSTLQQLLSNRKGSQSSEDKDWAEAIRDHSALEKLIVWRGGPIIVGASLQRNLHWLHCFSSVTGAQEIAPGLWMGGDVAQILHRVAQNQVDGPLVRLCFGHTSWETLQLRVELESGVWVRARALETVGGGDGLSVTATACLDDGEKAWQKTLLSTGLPELANFPRNVKADAKLRLHIAHQVAGGRKKDDAKNKAGVA